MRTYWIARARTTNGKYKHHRIARTDDQCRADGKAVLSFEQAAREAWNWFESSSNFGRFSDALPIGIREELNYTPVGNIYTVGHALAEFLEWKRLAAAKSYVQTLVTLINHHLLPRLGTLPAEEMNGEQLKVFVQDVLETAPAHSRWQPVRRRFIESIDEESLRKRRATVNTLIGVLRMALQMAWENRKIDNERAWRTLRRIPNVVRPRVLHLSRPECRELLSVCRPDLKRFVLGALYTGCRTTELLRMQACHVGRDGYGVYVTPVKKYRPRFVFLPDEGMIFFLELARGKRANDLLFVRDDGKPWFMRHRPLFKAAIREAGLPAEFTFHGLRHTYASQLVQAGTPLPVVAEQLGHANSQTVSTTYGHLSPQIRESEVRQRFSVLSADNARRAQKNLRKLGSWRKSLHGSDWRTYANISDVGGSPERGR